MIILVMPSLFLLVPPVIKHLPIILEQLLRQVYLRPVVEHLLIPVAMFGFLLFALHQEILAVPFVNGTCEKCRAAELFTVIRDLACLGLAKDKTVLTVNLDDEVSVLGTQISSKFTTIASSVSGAGS